MARIVLRVNSGRLAAEMTALTARELEVLGHILVGTLDKAILIELECSSIAYAKRSALQKLGCRNLVEAVYLATTKGWLYEADVNGGKD